MTRPAWIVVTLVLAVLLGVVVTVVTNWWSDDLLRDDPICESLTPPPGCTP